MKDEARIPAVVLHRFLCALLSAYGGEYVESVAVVIGAMTARKGEKYLVYPFHL